MNDRMTRCGRMPAATLALVLTLAGCAAREDTQEPARTGQDSSPTEQEIVVMAMRREERQDLPAILEADAANDQTVAGRAPPAAKLRRERVAGVASPGYVPDAWRHAVEPLDRENYAHLDPNPVRLVNEDPVSTFSIDVDTGAYTNVRRMLNEGRLPPADAVRVEELINYFDYAYPVPASTQRPFSVNTELAAAPWNADRLLLQIGIKGYEVPAADRPPANLVFLIDVSGSMNDPRKLPLLKQSMKLLARQLKPEDRVSMVVYAGAAGVVLQPTPGNRQAEILAALDRLQAGGSTNGAGGIRAAYQLARQAFVPEGINRILLATDGDFNVGTVDFESLVDLVEREREGGVSLTTLGFGTGNYNDHLVEQLADAGNGNYAYIDNLNEGRKVLVDQVGSTLQTIAKDVKIQVEFNPAVVAEYRLIGYENRMLRREDFNNDQIDAGEIGAGHTVTALYELTLTDSPARLVDPLRYGASEPAVRGRASEAAFVRLRYKAPDGDVSQLIERPVRVSEVAGTPSDELRFAASVAAFGERLRGGDYLGDYQYGDRELVQYDQFLDDLQHRRVVLPRLRLSRHRVV